MPIIIAATILSGMYVAAYATSNSTADLTTLTDLQMGTMPMEGGRMGRGNSGYGSVEISSAYNQTVMSIVNADSDVSSLLSQGYIVKNVRAVIKSVVQGDGAVVTSATTAIVELVNGTSGRAMVNVDVANAKETQIEIMTRTVTTK